MSLKKVLIIVLINFGMAIYAQEKGDLFLYIPTNEAMSDYINMHSYLSAWEKNEIEVDDLRFGALFTNYIGKDTLQSLLFESFFRNTKNKGIQNRILTYIERNNINTNFSNTLKKLYSAIPVTRRQDGKDIIQYNYNNLEYDENIDLFSFEESQVFNRELGLLLFTNDWSIITFNNENNTDEDTFILIYGGGTNSMTIRFRKYMNIDENNIGSKLNLIYFQEKYKENWKIAELPLDGILSRAGADKIIMVHALGPDIIETIETGTFNIYLYNKNKKMLYEVGYFMNFSPININFSERNRIFNYLFFQTLFVFIQ
jgi:hypothetical protein